MEMLAVCVVLNLVLNPGPQVPDSTRPLLRQIEALQTSLTERQRVWAQARARARLSLCVCVCVRTRAFARVRVRVRACAGAPPF